MKKAIEVFVKQAGEKNELFCDFPGSECGYCNSERKSCYNCEYAMGTNYFGWQMGMVLKKYPCLNKSTTFVIEPLLDPSKEESSNNGNYRHYMQFLRTADGYWVRDFYSYHGDIEEMPDYEEVTGKEFREWFLQARKDDEACYEYEASFWN